MLGDWGSSLLIGVVVVAVTVASVLVIGFIAGLVHRHAHQGARMREEGDRPR
jgi:hypothetical protein